LKDINNSYNQITRSLNLLLHYRSNLDELYNLAQAENDPWKSISLDTFTKTSLDFYQVKKVALDSTQVSFLEDYQLKIPVFFNGELYYKGEYQEYESIGDILTYISLNPHKFILFYDGSTCYGYMPNDSNQFLSEIKVYGRYKVIERDLSKPINISLTESI
jgi:hypothetical protein